VLRSHRHSFLRVGADTFLAQPSVKCRPRLLYCTQMKTSSTKRYPSTLCGMPGSKSYVNTRNGRHCRPRPGPANEQTNSHVHIYQVHSRPCASDSAASLTRPLAGSEYPDTTSIAKIHFLLSRRRCTSCSQIIYSRDPVLNQHSQFPLSLNVHYDVLSLYSHSRQGRPHPGA